MNIDDLGTYSDGYLAGATSRQPEINALQARLDATDERDFDTICARILAAIHRQDDEAQT